MSEAKPLPTGPEQRWRKEQPSNFKNIERRGRMVLLAMGAVVLASIIIGSWWMLGRAPQTYLYCYPYGSFNNALLSPAPWFYHDATQLLQTFGFDNKNIRTKIERKYILEDLNAIKDETVLIYVAGRGIARNNQAYVLPSDATDDPSTWISLDSLIKAITKSPATHKLLLLDIAGTAPNLYTGPLQDSVADVIHNYLAATPPSFPVLTSCSRGETSNIMAVTGTSVFGYYLNQALQGLANGFGNDQKDEQITVKELMNFVSTRVNRWATLNLGRTQTPKSYGPESKSFLVVHRRKVAWLDEPPKAAETPAPPDESKLSDKEKQESKDKRDKQQKEIDQARLKVIFPDELEKGWTNYDSWLAALLQQGPRIGGRNQDTTEYPLRLATLNSFAHRLRQYEETLMLFNNSLPSGQSQENQSLLANLNTSASRAGEMLARIDKDTRQERLPNSMTALWPRSWLEPRSGMPRDIPKELVNAFEALYQSLPGNTPASVKADTKIDDKAFLVLVSGRKDEKNPGPSLHLEALFLCWDTLCEDTQLTLAKLKFIDELMKKILAEKLRDKLNARCNELDLLKWIIEQSEGESEWNFVSSKEYETNREPVLNYFEMIHQWLMVEYLAERCANGYLPDGIGFAARRPALESVEKQHQNLIQELLALKKRKKYRPLSSEMVDFAKQLKALSGEYARCLKDMDQERTVLNAWWDAVAVLQATAEMMVSEDDSKLWLQWEKLADTALKLRPLLQAKSLDSSARDSIQGVVQARKELVDSMNNLTSRLLTSVKKEGSELESSRSIERVLKSGLLTSANRKELHGVLIKLQQKNHSDTVNIEREDDKGTGYSLLPLNKGLSTEAQAKRRAHISRQLLRLGGLLTMENTMTPQEDELRKAWTEEMPKLQEAALSKAKWLDAARIQAVLPQTDKTDALLKWRLEISAPYHQWLNARQQQLEARQLHVAELWK